MDATHTNRSGSARRHCEVAAVMLLRADGAALLQHRDDKPGLPRAGLWVPPGGHLDPGEAPVDGARRELYEETGYRCGPLHRLTAFVDEVGGGHPPQFLHVFWAEHDGAQAVQCLEGQGLEFVPRARAAELPRPDFLVPVWDHALGMLLHATRYR
jgi:8-oxo-dGTP pyrophosphatase MutT (NUDIX family)